MMLAVRYFALVSRGLESLQIPTSTSKSSVVVCAAKGPRPRYAKVWKTNKRIGTISKSAKLVQSIKELSNVKEEVYGALDSFIAWELEFPLITVKKAIKTLEEQKEWKRIIQVTKWMLSKGQGRTMGTYFTLLNALAEDGRLEEAEELWSKLFAQNLESTPKKFFDKMIAIYYHRRMHDKMFEIFADMEELGIRPNVSIVSMVGKVFQELGMLDKYKKLTKKYSPQKWVYRYIKGKRIRVRAKDQAKDDGDADQGVSKEEESIQGSNELLEGAESGSNELLEGAESGSNELLEGAESSSNESGDESEEADLESNDLIEEAEMSTDENQS